MKRFIYADNAATTKLDADAFEAMKPFLLEEFANASQPYSFSRRVKKAIKDARVTIANCIGADPDEIYLTSGGMESDNWVIKGVSSVNVDKKPIITTAFEHHAVLNACRSVERLGYPVCYIMPDRTGHILPETLSSVITSNTMLVSVMMANNELGTIQDIASLSSIAHSHGALFHSDAVQAVGHIQVNVKKLGVDFLSASAHKFNGPKGIGFLYINKEIKDKLQIIPFHDGGQQEFGLRAGTEDVASMVAMAKALEKNCSSLDNNIERVSRLERLLLSGLKDAGVPFLRNGEGNHLPGVLNLSFKNMEGETLMHRMDLKGIMISTGAACDSKNTVISHVLQAVQIPEEQAKNAIRISLSKANTEEDIYDIVAALSSILSE